MKTITSLLFFAIVLTTCIMPACTSKKQGATKQVPVNVIFNTETLFRSEGSGDGDNWCITWAADGSQITSMDDGNWMGGEIGYHNRLYRISGDPVGFTWEEVHNYPDFIQKKKWVWFGYGIVSVDGAIYSAISKTPLTKWSGPFSGIKLLRSDNNGHTWSRIDRFGKAKEMRKDDEVWNEVSSDEMFFYEESGITREKKTAYPFSTVSFVQQGQDNSLAPDNFVYIYSPEGAYTHKLLLARTPKEKTGFREAWEYFVRYGNNGQPIWSKDLSERGYVYEFPEKNEKGEYFGWYSWLPSVVWNKGLGLYIMVNGGTYGGQNLTASDEDYYSNWMHTKTGSLGFWYSEKPYGPWHEFYYTDYWTPDDPGNRTYQPKLSPKWISTDGKEMIFIWSDAMRNDKGKSHTVNYKWNQMKITIETSPSVTLGIGKPKD